MPFMNEQEQKALSLEKITNCCDCSNEEMMNSNLRLLKKKYGKSFNTKKEVIIELQEPTLLERITECKYLTMSIHTGKEPKKKKGLVK
jgi:hypothetical protein